MRKRVYNTTPKHSTDVASYYMPSNYDSKDIDKLVTPRSDYDKNYRRRYVFRYRDHTAITMGFASGSKDDYALFLHKYSFGNVQNTGTVMKYDMPRRMIQDKWLLGHFQKVARQDNGKMFGHTVNRFYDLYNHAGPFIHDTMRHIKPSQNFLMQHLNEMTRGYKPSDHMEVYMSIANLAMTSEYYYNSQYKIRDLEHQYHDKFTPDEETDLFNSPQSYHYNFHGHRGMTRPKYALSTANKRLKLIGFYQTVIEGQDPAKASKLSYSPNSMRNFMNRHQNLFPAGSQRRNSWVQDMQRKRALIKSHKGTWAQQLRRLGDVCHKRIRTDEWKQDINRPNHVANILATMPEPNYNRQQDIEVQEPLTPQQKIRQIMSRSENNFENNHNQGNYNHAPRTQRHFHKSSTPFMQDVRRDIRGMGLDPDKNPNRARRIQQHRNDLQR